jgi:hypothetical protein
LLQQIRALLLKLLALLLWGICSPPQVFLLLQPVLLLLDLRGGL